MGTLSQLDILGRVVRSPRCRQLSFLPFNILRQPSISTKSTVVPQTAKDWENVLERAAGIHYDLYEMDMEVVSSDAAYMARETIAKNTAIHCELKIAIQEMKGGNTMYSYIGSIIQNSAPVGPMGNPITYGRFPRISPAARM